LLRRVILRPHFFFAFLAFISLATASHVQAGNEARDPALVRAVQDGLNGSDPHSQLLEIGEIAAGGNIPAQVFVDQVIRGQMALDFPSMERAEILALLPEATAEYIRPRFGNRIDRTGLPANRANALVRVANAPEDWVEIAEILSSAGLYGHLHWIIFIQALSRGNTHFIENYHALKPFIRDDPVTQREHWAFLMTEQAFLNHQTRFQTDEVTHTVKRWQSQPWGEEEHKALSKALAERHWHAISLLAHISLFEPDETELFYDSQDPILNKWATAYWNTSFARPGELVDLSDQELLELGQVIEDDAARSAYLLPLKNSCDVYCPSEPHICMAQGALNNFNRLLSQGNYFWEEYVAPDFFAASPFAARELAYQIGQHNVYAAQNDLSRAIEMPSFYLDAASDLVAIARSE